MVIEFQDSLQRRWVIKFTYCKYILGRRKRWCAPYDHQLKLWWDCLIAEMWDSMAYEIENWNSLYFPNLLGSVLLLANCLYFLCKWNLIGTTSFIMQPDRANKFHDCVWVGITNIKTIISRSITSVFLFIFIFSIRRFSCY